MNGKFSLGIISILFFFISNSMYGAVPAIERAALIALYNATGGDGWTNNSGWKTPPLHTDGFAMPGTEGGWYGIYVQGNHVIEIYPSDNKLTGSIPSELGNLDNLQTLYLQLNQLSGSIPSQLGNLSNLTILVLGENQLSGSIPSQLGNLGNLKELWLHSNQLSGSIPPELGYLSNLQYLALYLNQLSGSIPSQLGNLSNLTTLRLGQNQLSGGIPSQLGNLSNLTALELNHNQFSGSIPPELGNLSNLQFLSLYSSQLSGSIPPELGNLSNLIYLELGENQLSGSIPPELGNLTNLESLGCFFNQLSGSIPYQLRNLGKLRALLLNLNQLSGSIPSQLGNLGNLEDLFLDANQLSGTIPSELGNLSNLVWLSLDLNQLSGTIPPELGNLTNLEHLTLYSNQLSGGIPSELGNLVKLLDLNLSSNQLSGSIPSQLGNLSNLEDLILCDNQLSGEIPSSLTNLENISVLCIMFNCLYASDPALIAWLNAHEPAWETAQNECGETEPAIHLNRDNLYFSALTSGIVTNSQEVWIENSGGGTLNWTTHTDASWLIHTPESGTNRGIITVSVDITGLAVGSYTGTIAITDSNAANTPQTVSVTLEVKPNLQGMTPSGEFTTPLDSSTVRGSIPVTGWALDDIGIESVKIYRGGEKKSLVLIGDAVFIEGARPDVEATYPDYPFNYKAGWGYMLLTNFLPNGGNGVFTLHAIATDLDGHSVTLGIKTIMVDNANAVKPFGAIDTPTQGGFASGSTYINWGWALTPQPNRIPTDGSTINVWVDSVDLGHPTYNIYRADIAALFPDFANSNGAAGYFYLDTTAYENGTHTIHWIVTDSAGNTDGIGSRYFLINNSDSTSEQNRRANATLAGIDILRREDIPVNVNPIWLKHGYHDKFSRLAIPADEIGIHIIQAKELELIQIELKEQLENQFSSRFYGYLIVNNRLERLPVGSTLDRKKRIFYWQPGPGFIGEYHFLFIEKEETRLMNRKEIIVNIIPKFPITDRGKNL